MDLLNKVVLITGAKRVGAVVAAHAAARGADVAVSYNHSEREAAAAAAEVRARGRKAMIVKCDVSNADACGILVDDVARELGRLDVLVNMASLYRAIPFDELTTDDWERQLHVDLRGTYLCAKAAVPHMRRAGGGRIINFSDWVAASGRPRYPGYVPYYVAKAGVVALTEAMALELAPSGILVNAIAPGPIEAPEGASADEIRAVERAKIGRAHV